MDPNCEVCKNSKLQRAPHIQSHKRADRYEKPALGCFGELTADHAIMGHGEEGRGGEGVCFMILDRRTGWTGAYPAKTKSAEEVSIVFRSFVGDGNLHIKRVYTDGSKGFEKALRDLHYPMT